MGLNANQGHVEHARRDAVACALEGITSAQGQDAKGESAQDAAGDAGAPAAPVSPVAPVAPVAPVPPVSPVAPGAPVSPVAPVAPVAPGLASAEASGAGVSSDFVQAVAAKNMEHRTKIRNFRITTSFIFHTALAKRSAFKTALRIL
jgi:hypothetical protein